MPVKTVIVTIARGLVFAGCLLSLIGLSGSARGGSPSGLKDTTLRGLDHERIQLAAPAGGATVVVFYSTECPISNAYSPTLDELMTKFGKRSVEWIGICVDPDLSNSEVRTHAQDFRLKLRIARDRHGSFARKIGATMTPEAFVMDDKGLVRYHGRIDDQYVDRRVRNAAPGGSELRDAIAAVLDGKAVAVPHVAAVGCPIPEAPEVAAHPTYSKDVAPVLQKNCQECHRRGQVGPFSFETYEQARKRATDIVTVIEDRLMPPWKASPHVGVKFKDERILSEKEISTIIAWSEAVLRKAIPATSRRRPGSPTTGSSARPT